MKFYEISIYYYGDLWRFFIDPITKDPQDSVLVFEAGKLQSAYDEELIRVPPPIIDKLLQVLQQPLKNGFYYVNND